MQIYQAFTSPNNMIRPDGIDRLMNEIERLDAAHYAEPPVETDGGKHYARVLRDSWPILREYIKLLEQKIDEGV